MIRRSLACAIAAASLVLIDLGAVRAQEAAPETAPAAPAAPAAAAQPAKAPQKAERARTRHERRETHAAAAPAEPAPTAAAPAAAAQPASAAPQQSAAAPVICTLSRETIVASAAVNVSAAQRLAQLRLAAQTEIAEGTKALQAESKALDGDSRPPADEGLKKARESLADRSRALAQRADLLNRELDATLRSVNQQIQAAALPIVQAVETNHACTLLLTRDSVLDGKGTVDITQPVLSAMDAQLHGRPFDLVTLAAAAPQVDGRSPQ